MKNNKIVYNNTCDGFYNALDVHFTYACDNNCSFCIDKMYPKNEYKLDLDKMVKATKKIKPDIMLILGGEPFIIYDKLCSFVNQVRQYIKELYITTTLPIVFKENLIKTYNIIDIIDGLNITVQSIDWEENNNILKASINYNRIKVIEKIVKKYPKKVRINLNLVKGVIDTKNKLYNVLDYFNDIGVEKVKINELQHTSKNYVSYEEIMDFKWPSPYAHGCQTYLTYKNISILVKRACFITEDTRRASLKDILKIILQLITLKVRQKYRVLWGDGKVTNNWRRI